jgi:hypothetical protein
MICASDMNLKMHTKKRENLQVQNSLGVTVMTQNLKWSRDV